MCETIKGVFDLQSSSGGFSNPVFRGFSSAKGCGPWHNRDSESKAPVTRQSTLVEFAKWHPWQGKGYPDFNTLHLLRLLADTFPQ